MSFHRIMENASRTEEQFKFLYEAHDELAWCLKTSVLDLNERRRRCLTLARNLTKVEHLRPFDSMYCKILSRFGEQALRALLFSLVFQYGIREERFIWAEHNVWTNDSGVQEARPRPEVDIEVVQEKEKERKKNRKKDGKRGLVTGKKNVIKTDTDAKAMRRWLILSHLDFLNNMTMVVAAADLTIKYGYFRDMEVKWFSGGRRLCVPKAAINDAWREEMMSYALTALVAVAGVVSHLGDGELVRLGSKKVVKCGCEWCMD